MEELLHDAYRVEESSASVVDLLPLYAKINKLFQAGDFDTFNEFLANLDVTQTATLVLIGILRLSYSAKDKLSNWNDVVTRTFAVLQTRDSGRPEVLLHGLNRPNSLNNLNQ